LTPTRITVHAFLKPHLAELSKHFDVTLAYNPDNDTYAPPLSLSIRQVHIGIKRKIELVADLRALLELYAFFRREKFDLVISLVPKAGLLGMVAAWLARVPRRVHLFQGEVWASRQGFMRLLLKTTDRIAARAATQVLAVGKGEKAFLEAQGIVSPARIQVLGSGSISGVDVGRFKPDPSARNSVREKLDIPENAVVCLFLGRLYREKGIFELIEAFKEAGSANENLWLLLVGPDEEKIVERLGALLPEGLKQRLRIEGYTSEPEKIYAAADFFCLPSYREGFAVSILEAAAVGVPAIGSRIYGIADGIVEEETGLLVPPQNAQELAHAITRLTRDNVLRERMSKAGRTRIQNEFEQHQVVSRYVDCFRSLFDSEKRAGASD
jgi:glycosyltransferase involved in cell wall biosynthesis